MYKGMKDIVDATELLFLNLCLTRANSAWVGNAMGDTYFELCLRTPAGIWSLAINNQWRHLIEGRVCGMRRGWDKMAKGSFVEFLIDTAEKVGG